MVSLSMIETSIVFIASLEYFQLCQLSSSLLFRYHDEFHSIFPMGDISALIPDDEADICVLEEPEHLNW
jgi:hypothetical protein